MPTRALNVEDARHRARRISDPALRQFVVSVLAEGAARWVRPRGMTDAMFAARLPAADFDFAFFVEVLAGDETILAAEEARPREDWQSLSDSLFVMSRHASRLYGESEPLWEPEKT